MTFPSLTCDPDAMALYIQFSGAEIQDTVELSQDVYLDIGTDGQMVGIEILNANKDLLSRIPVLPDTAALKDLLNSHAA